MNLEWIILYVVWFLTFCLIFIIPKKKRRLAFAAFLFKQVITWILGLIVVEKGLIVYPVRCFASVNRTSFTYEFLAFPVVCGVFNAYYPHSRGKMAKFFYFASYCTFFTIIEAIIEAYTDLVEYIHWNWFWTWTTLFITFLLSRWFCVWFFKGISKEM